MQTAPFAGPMPLWGPYSKKYMGVSRVIEGEEARGVRFDLSVFPTRANSGNPPLNVTFPTGYHPWEASADLSYFSYRVDMEWKDVVYADVSFSRMDPDSVLIRTEIFNHSPLFQNCLLNLFASIEYPCPSFCEVSLPAKNTFLDALDYTEYEYASPRPWDHLNPDGMKKGEIRDPGSSGGHCLGDRISRKHVPHLVLKPFGGEKGDRVSYQVNCDNAYVHPVLVLRYRSREDAPPRFRLLLNGKEYVPELPFHAEMELCQIPLEELPQGKNSLSLVSLGGGGIELDFLAVVEEEEAQGIRTEHRIHENKPEVCQKNGQVEYAYPGIGQKFFLYPLYDKVRFREIPTGCLEDALVSRLSNPDPTFDRVTETFSASFQEKKSDEGFFHNTILESVYLPPEEKRVLYAIVSTKPIAPVSPALCEKVYQQRRSSRVKQEVISAGETYALSNQLLNSALLCNVVYPVYRHGKNIIHHTPGKRWDSLDTWDSGFIGLGLLECSADLAEYILDTYLSEEGNPDFAFLHHGSPVPVQFYLFAEIYKRSGNREKLKKYYPLLKRYYSFLAGKSEGSTTNRFQSGLTTTYDYFYNAGGMDDYPPQVVLHKNKMEESTAPCLSTSHVIRCAKFLKYVTEQMGYTKDASEFAAEIDAWTKALQKYAWDEESGYFGYVVHDETGNPVSLLRTETGENLNKGTDGIYPLLAGACTESQRDRILSHLKNPQELLTPVGLSAVDRSASYYIDNGYWNGNVWFPHQWFVWKTMLDLGERDFAFQIASIALEAWKKETDATYNTFEMLHIATGRGGWYHQFGGLSSVINIWFHAYYQSGTLSTGFDTWPEKSVFSEEKTQCELSLRKTCCGQSTVVVVMNPSFDYDVTINGKPAEVGVRMAGVLEITLEQERSEIKIKKQMC